MKGFLSLVQHQGVLHQGVLHQGVLVTGKLKVEPAWECEEIIQEETLNKGVRV